MQVFLHLRAARAAEIAAVSIAGINFPCLAEGQIALFYPRYGSQHEVEYYGP